MKLNTNSNVYTIVYATILVVIVAFLLAVVAAVLKPRQEANVALDTKKQILYSLNQRTLTNTEAEAFYMENVTEKTCEKCGLSWFEANIDGATKYVLPVRGAGLWGPIWGYVALDDDKNTIFGIYFNHEGETPGLGGEIKEYYFQERFFGKHLLNADGNFVSIAVMKAGQAADGMEQVDAVSGATITSKGVESMLMVAIAPYAEAGWFGNANATADQGEVEANVELNEETEVENAE